MTDTHRADATAEPLTDESQGDACQCPLCQFDRALAAAEARGSENERLAFERLSMALTHGAASTWDELFHAAEARGAAQQAGHVALLERQLSLAVDVASIFQPGGALSGKLPLGGSSVVDGLKWLIAEYFRLSAAPSPDFTRGRAAGLREAADKVPVKHLCSSCGLDDGEYGQREGWNKAAEVLRALATEADQ